MRSESNKSGRLGLVMVFMIVAAAFSNFACDSSDKDVDASDGDNEEQGDFKITVHYKDQAVDVKVADLDVETVSGQEAVSLAAVVAAAELDVDVDSLYFDFEAEDGYRPSSRDNCVEIIPVTGAQLALAYVALESHDMLWDASLDYPGCASVKGLSDIFAADNPEGIDPVNYEVTVYYYGIKSRIDAGTLPTQEIDGAASVVVKDIIEASEFTFDMNTLQFDFVAKDGFRPGMSANCQDNVPVRSPALENGFVNLSDKSLFWDASLDFPGCMNVDDFATIIVTDIEPAPYTITVKYHELDTRIDLHKLSSESVNGEALVSIATFVQEAGIEADLNSLIFDFEAGDGYRSGEQPECMDILPMSGADIGNGYVSQESHKLVWITDGEVLTCLALKNVTIIHVADIQ